MKHINSRFQRDRRTNIVLLIILVVEILVILSLLVYFFITSISRQKNESKVSFQQTSKNAVEVKTGKIISEESVRNFSASEVKQIINQTNKRFDSPINSAITKQVYVYNSSDGKNNDVQIYGRAYLPITTSKKPVLVFAPGTTGIGDQCAGSLENPAKRDWANYDSLMLAYASQGYVVIITDYEGMRDPSRIHHYMVGELEAKALLDAARSAKNLSLTKDQIDNNQFFFAGYSQGGHAAFWADQLRDSYATDINLRGVIGFAPVTNVEETLDDAVNGANINWFGPFVLTSYMDWYKREYPISKILLPRWAVSYKADSLRECIDRVNQFWPNNIGANRSNQIYTPEFIRVAKNLNIMIDPNYSQFSRDLAANIVGNVRTDRPKMINHGDFDNVVLVSQSQHTFERMCAKSNQVKFNRYNTSLYAIQTYNPSGQVDHYQTMNASFKDTLSWMNAIIAAKQIQYDCN